MPVYLLVKQLGDPRAAVPAPAERVAGGGRGGRGAEEGAGGAGGAAFRRAVAKLQEAAQARRPARVMHTHLPFGPFLVVPRPHPPIMAPPV